MIVLDSRLWVAIVLCLCGAVSSANASGPGGVALSDELIERAEEPFFDGVSAYNQGKYAEAATKFEAAYALIPHQDLLFNIARCHEQLKDFSKAVSFYEKYLSTTPVDETAVIHRVRLLKKRMGPLGDTPAPVAQTPTPAELVAETPAAQSSSPIPWKYVAVGGGAVSAAVGMWMGLDAMQTAAEAREASSDGETAKHEELKESALSSAAVADVSYLLTAVSAGVAWWLFSADSSADDMAELSVGVDGRGIRVNVGF